MKKLSYEELKRFASQYIDERYTVQKDGIVIAPRKSEFYQWEDFNTSNPCILRLPGADEAYLGYRAGGSDGKHIVADDYYSWASELGLAVLSSDFKEVKYRFPLSIWRPERNIPLPKTNEEFHAICKDHPAEEIAYHDFRLWDFGDEYIYLYYHKGWMQAVEDCIRRMPKEEFLSKISRSKEMIDKKEVTEERWYTVWKHSDWEPAGVNGTESFYGSALPKNNIDVYRLADGRLHCTHRPAPENAIIDLNGHPYIPATEDGISAMSVWEKRVRMDGFDNSHLGSNGADTPVRFFGKDFLLDISHGVSNLGFQYEGREAGDMFYLPFFRVKDGWTGEVLYLSQSPAMKVDDEWKEWCYDGNWVSCLENFCFTSFPGGQYPEVEGKNTENDTFYAFIGLGDTATGRVKFRPIDMMPPLVRENLAHYHEYKEKKAHLRVPENRYEFDKPFCGDWKFAIANVNGQMSIVYSLERTGETFVRPVHRDAACFDFNMTLFDGKSVYYEESIGWLVGVQGVTFSEKDGKTVSRIGYGVLVLQNENPARIIYRSKESIVPVEEREGIAYSDKFRTFTKEELLAAIPEKAKKIRAKMRELEPLGRCYPSTYTAWLKDKSDGIIRYKPDKEA